MTGVSRMPVRPLVEGSFELRLASAMHVQSARRGKTHANDGMWLADLLAQGLIRGRFVPPTPIQDSAR